MDKQLPTQELHDKDILALDEDDEDVLFLQNLLHVDDEDDPSDNTCSAYHANDFNAVHMFVQENAKVPNINFSVDRKQPKSEDSPVFSGMDLMEMFLGTEDRTSSALAYSNVSSSNAFIKSSSSARSLVSVNMSESSSMLEPSNRIYASNKPDHSKSDTVENSIKIRRSNESSSVSTTKSMPQSVTEATALPIDSTAVAIAAAAAAAATSSTTSFPIPSPAIMRSFPLPIPFLPSSVTNPPPSGLHSKNKIVNNKWGGNVHTPTKIHLDASRDKNATTSANQFGFGRNHFVPSVPKPPTIAKNLPPHSGSKVHGNGERKNSLSDQSNISNVGQKNGLEVHSTASIPVNEAYERKKQRAKDGRVKLNESIDHLSIAMGLASTQSLKRSRAIAALGFSGRSTLESMGNCIKIAEGAKKWERPSFIGAAAKMIEALNLQCELLMKECSVLKEKSTAHHSHDENIVYDNIGTDNNSTSNGPLQSTLLQSIQIEPLAKRQKFEVLPQRNVRTSLISSLVSSILSNSRIMLFISEFLCPCSLLNCLSVSKSWAGIEAFQANLIWRKLIELRYGSQDFPASEGDEVKLIDVFRKMNEDKIAPRYVTNSIGEVQVSGLQAWASIVHRSNGYLNCSVKVKSKEDGGTDIYTSLPIVELKIVVQNINLPHSRVLIPNQTLSIDCSTRRKGGQMIEVLHDERFTKTARKFYGGKEVTCIAEQSAMIACLSLFEATILSVHFHAKGCTTVKKFLDKANFLKILVEVSGRTIPLCIPLNTAR